MTKSHGSPSAARCRISPESTRSRHRTAVSAAMMFLLFCAAPGAAQQVPADPSRAGAQQGIGTGLPQAVQAGQPAPASGQVAASAPGAEPTITVVATGLGVTPDEALKAAFSSAVQQAVGTVVDAETLVRNDQLVKDQILTYSNAYITSFDKVAEGAGTGGLIEVKIKAVVRKGQLIQKLREVNVTVAEVQGQSLFAEAFTQRQERASATELVNKALEGLPERLLLAQLVSEKPKILKNDASGVTAEWTVRLGFNMQEYYRSVVPALNGALSAVAKKKGDHPVVTVATVNRQNDFTIHTDRYQGGGFGESLSAERNDNTFIVALNTGSNQKGDNLQWMLYAVDRELIGCFSRTEKSVPVLRVTFRSADGSVVRTEDVDLKRSGSPLFGARFVPWFFACNSPKATLLCPFPYMWYSSEFRYSLTATMPFSANFTDAEIQRIAKVECGFVDPTGGL